jgi:hypothetical protein
METTKPAYEVKISLPNHHLDEKVPADCIGTLTIKFTYKPTEGFRSIHLTGRTKPLLTLSITGRIKYGTRGAEHGGQCVDEIRKIWGHIPEVSELCDLWDRWHLNDLRAGTKAQMEIIRKLSKCPVPTDWYTWACLTLKSHDLLEDRGYSFGREWLFEVIPVTVVKRIQDLAKNIDYPV